MTRRKPGIERLFYLLPDDFSQGRRHCLAHHTYSVGILWMRRCRMNEWMDQRCCILNRDTLYRRWAQPLSLPATGTMLWMSVDNQDSTRGRNNKDKHHTESGKPYCLDDICKGTIRALWKWEQAMKKQKNHLDRWRGGLCSWLNGKTMNCAQEIYRDKTVSIKIPTGLFVEQEI